MAYEKARKFKAWLWLSMRFSWRRKGLWLRAVLCWMIGMAFLIADRENAYDIRLQLRGAQDFDRSIVLLQITRDDWAKWLGEHPDNFTFPKDASYLADSSYWDPNAWERLLARVLKEKPLVIGMSPYFGENIPQP